MNLKQKLFSAVVIILLSPVILLICMFALVMVCPIVWLGENCEKGEYVSFKSVYKDAFSTIKELIMET